MTTIEDIIDARDNAITALRGMERDFAITLLIKRSRINIPKHHNSLVELEDKIKKISGRCEFLINNLCRRRDVVLQVILEARSDSGAQSPPGDNLTYIDSVIEEFIKYKDFIDNSWFKWDRAMQRSSSEEERLHASYSFIDELNKYETRQLNGLEKNLFEEAAMAIVYLRKYCGNPNEKTASVLPQVPAPTRPDGPGSDAPAADGAKEMSERKPLPDDHAKKTKKSRPQTGNGLPLEQVTYIQGAGNKKKKDIVDMFCKKFGIKISERTIQRYRNKNSGETG